MNKFSFKIFNPNNTNVGSNTLPITFYIPQYKPERG